MSDESISDQFSDQSVAQAGKKNDDTIKWIEAMISHHHSSWTNFEVAEKIYDMFSEAMHAKCVDSDGMRVTRSEDIRSRKIVRQATEAMRAKCEEICRSYEKSYTGARAAAPTRLSPPSR